MGAVSKFLIQMMKNKKWKLIKKYILIFCVSVMIGIVALSFIPIKISIPSENEIKNDNYYIISLIPEGSTDSGSWICYDQDGKRYINVVFQGNLPQNILSTDIYASGTTFVIYGNLIKKSNSYILQSEDWDIIYNINRNCDSLRIDFKRFITIYDTKYFDFIFRSEY